MPTGMNYEKRPVSKPLPEGFEAKQYHIEHPIAAEIVLEAHGAGEIQEFCMAGLKLAVKEQRMPPEVASENWLRWFGVEISFIEE